MIVGNNRRIGKGSESDPESGRGVGKGQGIRGHHGKYGLEH